MARLRGAVVAALALACQLPLLSHADPQPPPPADPQPPRASVASVRGLYKEAMSLMQQHHHDSHHADDGGGAAARERSRQRAIELMHACLAEAEALFGPDDEKLVRAARRPACAYVLRDARNQ